MSTEEAKEPSFFFEFTLELLSGSTHCDSHLILCLAYASNHYAVGTPPLRRVSYIKIKMHLAK